MRGNPGRGLLWISAVLALGGRLPLSVASDAVAAAGASDASSDQGAQLQEVTVTAQRRAQSVQDVPISAQVIGGQSLQTQNTQSLDDLSQTLPAVHIGEGGRSDDLYIRGIGSGVNQSFDQSVGTFVDDIYYGRSRMGSAAFLDLDRVEILKGPQTTFFGNNAIAGALNIVTKKPTQEFDASVRALYGQGGQYALEGAVGGPITDQLAVRGAMIEEGTQGWLHNVATGKDQPDQNNLAGRLSFLWKPADRLDVLLKVEASKDRNLSGLFLQNADCPPPAPFVAAGFCKLALGMGLPTGIDNNFNAESPGQQLVLSSESNVLTVNDHLGGDTLTSVTGFYSYHYNLDLDTDGTPLTLLNVQAPERYHQLSEELRIASPTGIPLEYLGGLYFQTDHLAFNQDFGYFFLDPTLEGIPAFSPLTPYLPLGQETDFSQLEHTYSAFGAATWNATERLKLSAGLRASWDNKSYDWDLFYGTATQDYGGIVPLPASIAPLAQAFATAASLGNSGALAGHREDQGWMPSARIQYQLAPEAMSYFSYTRGFKAGGFNGADDTAIAANLPYQPEHVNAYELGEKSELLDRRLLVNLALFRSDYSDLQVAQDLVAGAGSFVTLVKNAAAARSQGVELESQWAVSRALRLSVEATYLDSRYLSYPNVTPTQLQQLEGLASQDLSGSPTAYAPQWSGSVAGDYTVALPAGLIATAEVSAYLTSSYYLEGVGTDDPQTLQPGYARLDARLTLESPDGHWALDVIGKNLTSRNVLVFYSTQPVSLGSALVQKEQPANIAVQVRYHW